MTSIRVKDLSAKAISALEARAAEHGLTTEAEVARIIEEVLVSDASPPGEKSTLGLATALRDLAMEFPELQDLDFSRDPSTARAASFE